MWVTYSSQRERLAPAVGCPYPYGEASYALAEPKKRSVSLRRRAVGRSLPCGKPSLQLLWSKALLCECKCLCGYSYENAFS